MLACLLGKPTPVQAETSLMVYDFELGSSPVTNADYLRSLGFGGVVTRCSQPGDLSKLSSYASHVATLSDFRLLAYVNYDFKNPNHSHVWREALPILASAGAPLWVIVKNAPSMFEVQDLILRMAQASQLFGVRTVLYPHWNTDIESASEAAALIVQVAHPNLSNSLHTCHEIRGGNQYNMGSVVAAHASTTTLVTVAGADANAYAGPPPAGGLPWSDAIKPLDRGRYSLAPFLQTLKNSGYNGPVILHTFGITGDPGHLLRSLEAYDKYHDSLL